MVGTAAARIPPQPPGRGGWVFASAWSVDSRRSLDRPVSVPVDAPLARPRPDPEDVTAARAGQEAVVRILAASQHVGREVFLHPGEVHPLAVLAALGVFQGADFERVGQAE